MLRAVDAAERRIKGAGPKAKASDTANKVVKEKITRMVEK
jgi:hypothetical protein